MATLRKLWVLLPFLAIFLMSHNASAVEIGQDVQFINGWSHPYWSDNNNRAWATGGYSYITNDVESANSIRLRNSSNSAISWSDGDWFSLSGSVYIQVRSQSQAVSIQANPRQYFAVSGTNQNVNCPIIELDETAFQQTTTDNSTLWNLRYNITTICRVSSGSSGYVSMDLLLNGGSLTGTDYLRFIPTYLGQWHARSGYDDSAVISAINRLNSTIQGLIDATDDITNAITEQGDKEQEAVDNIDNQSSEDISENGNTENSATTSIINLFGSFLGSLNNTSAGSCIVDLQFPNYAGGTWHMNLCQNRDKAGNIISFFGSATLVLFYLPVAWKLLSMIYAEIRSFTNG